MGTMDVLALFFYYLEYRCNLVLVVPEAKCDYWISNYNECAVVFVVTIRGAGGACDSCNVTMV